MMAKSSGGIACNDDDDDNFDFNYDDIHNDEEETISRVTFQSNFQKVGTVSHLWRSEKLHANVGNNIRMIFLWWWLKLQIFLWWWLELQKKCCLKFPPTGNFISIPSSLSFLIFILYHLTWVIFVCYDYQTFSTAWTFIFF